MKKTYETPIIEIDAFMSEDIITTSEVGPMSTINGKDAEGLEAKNFSIYS